ncbi:MAG: hypothetical protein P8Z67_06170 [Gammaproteobacteria bacterium]
MQDILEKAAQVKVVVFDVDGVLTDGGLFFGDDGPLPFGQLDALRGHHIGPGHTQIVIILQRALAEMF